MMKNLRSSLATLAAGALAASLLAVGAGPAGADIDTADHTTLLSACEGDATADRMFADVFEGHVFGDAINCIAYYGTTLGTGDGSRFSPNRAVTRAQMAVFIARAAEIADVDLGEAADAGFSDIGDTWQEAQDAINRLASKGILPKDDSFRPNDAMTRAEMAVALIGLLNKASDDVKINADGTITLTVGAPKLDVGAKPDNDNKDGNRADDPHDDDHFADARALSTRAVDRASAALFELGITKGASRAAVQDPGQPPLDFNYQPAGIVNRGQMAVFITRALAHTPVRPAGVSAQFDGTDVIVSVRDESFAPRLNVVVDVFRTDTDGVDYAFGADGSCAEVDKVSSTGTYLCQIDGTDPITGAYGDVRVAFSAVDDGGTTVWAWTGDHEDEVDDKTRLFRLDIDEDAVVSIADRVRVSTEFDGDKAHLGSSVRYTAQLQDADGEVRVGLDGRKSARLLVTLSTHEYVGTQFRDAAMAVRQIPLITDSRGKATFLVAAPADPDPSLKGDKYRVDIRIQERPSSSNAPSVFYIGTSQTPALEDATGRATVGNGVIFSTEDAVASKVSVETSSYVLVAGRSNQDAYNRATVKVTDQFDDPVRNATVTLTSDLGDHATNDDDDGASSLARTEGGAPRDYTTGSDGTYTFAYTWTGNGGDVETLTAVYDPTPEDDDDAASSNNPDITVNPLPTVRWAQSGGTSGSNQQIVTGDVDANQIIVEMNISDGVPDRGSVPMVVTYDDNDRFNISTGAFSAATPKTMEEFEEQLAKWLATTDDTSNAAELVTWSNYDSRARNVSVFTLHTS